MNGKVMIAARQAEDRASEERSDQELHDFFRNAQAGATGEELLRLVWAIVCYRGFSSPIVAAGNTVD
jgi:hypothetical protein